MYKKRSEIMKVAIGTKNKAKVKSVEKVLSELFHAVEFESYNIESGVSEQPFSEEETRQGAVNRAINTLNISKADLNFGLEGGVKEIDNKLYCVNWGALALKDGTTFTAGGATFLLPDEISKQLRQGKTLGAVMENFTNIKNINHSEGAIGIFTANLIDRSVMFEHIVKILIGNYLYSKKWK